MYDFAHVVSGKKVVARYEIAARGRLA